MPQRVLNEDWNEYDNRKIRGSRDSAFFSCEEAWEVDYLVKKILKYHPNSEAKIRSAISKCCSEISGNSQVSLNYNKVIKVGGTLFNGVYLFPPSDEVHKTKLVLFHSSTPTAVLAKLKEFNSLLNNTDEFIKELQDVKTIKSAEDLRQRILLRLSNPRSAFKNAHQLQDVFKTSTANEIASFAKQLDMCNKA